MSLRRLFPMLVLVALLGGIGTLPAAGSARTAAVRQADDVDLGAIDDCLGDVTVDDGTGDAPADDTGEDASPQNDPATDDCASADAGDAPDDGVDDTALKQLVKTGRLTETV